MCVCVFFSHSIVVLARVSEFFVVVFFLVGFSKMKQKIVGMTEAVAVVRLGGGRILFSIISLAVFFGFCFSDCFILV